MPLVIFSRARLGLDASVVIAVVSLAVIRDSYALVRMERRRAQEVALAGRR